MSLTRAGVENELVGDLRGLLVTRFWSLSLAVDGTNSDLNGPIRKAIRSMGADTADALTVVDADLAPFSGLNAEQLIRYAKLETLRKLSTQFVDGKIQTGEDRQELDTIGAQLRAMVKDLEAEIATPMGVLKAASVIGPMGGSPGIPNDPFDPWRTRSRPCRWPYP